MHALARRVSSAQDILPFRERYRKEMNCQIVHDSLHTRRGWTISYALTLGDEPVGFGSMAVAGPWTDKPTLIEFYIVPEHRTRAFDLFEALLATCGASFMEIQSNDVLLATMLHTYAQDIWTEKIVFHDQLTTALPANGAQFRCVTPDDEITRCIEQRAGGPDCVLEIDGNTAASGGILFHYNAPYGDIYMEVSEAFRRRGLGAYLVQEMKRLAYARGAVPCARCSPTNIASRKTLQKAGFVPFALMLNGTIRPRPI